MRKICIVIGLSFFFFIGITTQASAQKCWDLDGSGSCDQIEDTNGDGKCNPRDCQGEIDPAIIEDLQNQISNLQDQINDMQKQIDDGDLPVIIWSGGCSGSTGWGTGWMVYCADRVDFNTTQDNLQIGSSGTFTVDVPGFYRINFFAASYGASYRNVRLIVNGVNILEGKLFEVYLLQPVDRFLDVTWLFEAGDWFRIEVMSEDLGVPPYAPYVSSAPNSHLQVTFEGT